MASPIDLVTLAQVQTALPNLTAAQLANAPAVITSASRAIANACRRPLALASFDKVYRPERTRTIRLETYPVAALTRLKTDLVVALTIQNTDVVTNQVATVQQTPTGIDPAYGPPKTLVLTRIASGVAVPATLTLSNYATLTDLAVAINALGGGWTATVGTALGPNAAINPALLPPSELNYDGGADRRADADRRTAVVCPGHRAIRAQ